MGKVNIFWFRRDLRLKDNTALYQALSSGLPVVPVFIFDTQILSLLPEFDRRVDFICQVLNQIHRDLVQFGSGLTVFNDSPLNVFEQLIKAYSIDSVYLNHDYEPYARQRDESIHNFLGAQNIRMLSYKDQVIFEKGEILKDDLTPYTVFTPYSKKWKARLTGNDLQYFPTELLYRNFYPLQNPLPVPTLPEIGFQKTEIQFEIPVIQDSILQNYDKTRDFPGVQGTSELGIHLRFGTLSIRELALKALHLNEKFLNELIWRDFYQAILWHFPSVVSKSFKPLYDRIVWRNEAVEFEAWCQGQTGYPIVDAGMRQLKTTGWMHNRIRMITASFLTKHLLIDWRWGEAWFALHLNDFDLASNNGGWQWAAGSGVDAAPYFRIFNPRLQTLKFDSSLTYIRKWVPEFETAIYPAPLIEHEMARKRCLETYQRALKPG